MVFRAFFPREPEPFDLDVERLSDKVDLALVRLDLRGRKILVLPLDRGGAGAVAGQPVVVVGYPAGLEAILAKAESNLVKDLINNAVGKIGENIQVRRFARLTARPGEQFASYIHGNGRIGVLVGIPGADEALGKDLAMHLAASDPRFAARAEVSEQVLETEREIARAQATAAGKPANVVERIANGKVEKFYQEAVLVEQAFVKDPEKTVGQVVVERAGKGALDLRFVRFKLGEGLGRAEEAA